MIIYILYKKILGIYY